MIKKLYNYLPVFLQNIALTSYGYYLQRLRYGGKSHRHVAELGRSQRFSKVQLEEMQRKRLRIIIKHAYENIPYYRNLFNNIGLSSTDIGVPEDLQKLPILEKWELKERLEQFVATNISKRKLIPVLTGGTTGTPLTLYMTKDAIQYNFALSEARVKHWAGVKSGNKLATFLGRVIVPISTKNPPFWRWNKAYNQLLFSSFHMSEDNLKYYVEKFSQFRPQIVQGYVSTVYTFAKYILNHQLKVFRPKAILLSSETLFSWQRQAIETAFHSKVYNGYSGAESVAFITECEEGGLHISPECGIVEFEKVSNEDDKYEIVGTNLFNLAMPLIRYRTRDIVTLSSRQKCPCGRELPLVKSIEGRTDGMLITPEGNYISPASLSLVFEVIKNIREAQIIQIRKDKIIVRIVRERGFTENDSTYLVEQLRERLGRAISISVEFLDKIERTKAGKFRFIISDIS